MKQNKNLGEESSRYWHVILNKTYQFRRLKIIAGYVKELSKECVIRFFDRYIAPSAPHRQKLCVTVVAKQHEEAVGWGGDDTGKTKNETTEGEEEANPSPVILVSDPKEFKRSMTLFPMPPKVDIDVVDLGIQKEK